MTQPIFIDGKEVRTPYPPIYFVKSNGHVIDITTKSKEAHSSFEACIASDKALWKVTEDGIYRCIRRTFYGTEQGRVADVGG